MDKALKPRHLCAQDHYDILGTMDWVETVLEEWRLAVAQKGPVYRSTESMIAYAQKCLAKTSGAYLAAVMTVTGSLDEPGACQDCDSIMPPHSDIQSCFCPACGCRPGDREGGAQ